MLRFSSWEYTLTPNEQTAFRECVSLPALLRGRLSGEVGSGAFYKKRFIDFQKKDPVDCDRQIDRQKCSWLYLPFSDPLWPNKISA